ncbi:choice-of-anchor D domain-containing protein [Kribbella sp. NPDC026611]|uniref:choice-of-anchor D domain-containing protein n=1 Tax=Kribbella sp. NPDC026611 TaxID=3154911 RepID=UPI0033CA7608
MTLVGTVWAPRGPSPISEGARRDNGLTSAIVVHPNDEQIVYQGTAGGGVWRTVDGGTHWTPLFDRQLSLGIGEPYGIAIDPNDSSTIYVGTSGRVTPQSAAGLYKSVDGGSTVVRMGSGFPAGNLGNADQFFTQSINVIIVDPADSRIVYLSSSSGVFRSTDGGLNWTRGTGSNGDARSLVLDTSSPTAARILYAGVAGRGVFQSTDGGLNWTAILTGTTPVVAAAIGAAPRTFGKVVVDLAPPTSPPAAGGVQVLYVALAGRGGAPDPVGLFMSTDQGATWTQRSATGMPTNTQGGYSFHFAVDPASPGDGSGDIIYFGCVGQARSTDAGATFTGMAGLHPDTHAWAFSRQPAPAPSTVYCGNDGGISRSTDGGSTWTSLTSGGLQTGLFYNLDVRPDATASVSVGALQDNQIETTSGGTGLGWVGTNGGDGWDVVYDGQIAGQMYATSGFWSPPPCTRVWRSTDDGVNWSEITPWGTTTDAGCYLSPLATDPSNGGVVYASGNQNLWQSQDGGGTWRIVGSFPGAGQVSVAPSDGNRVVVAVGLRVFVSSDALAAGTPTFTDITRNLPSRSVLRAAFDPADPTVVYAVLGGFDGSGPGQRGHVFRTTVGGTAWADVSPPVNVPHGALALDGTATPTTIYVGTDLGVLRSIDRGVSWSVLDDIHFPRVPVTDLVIGAASGTLHAATYGRGVFTLTTPDHPAIAVNLEANLDFGTVCDGTRYLTLQVFNVGGGTLRVDSVQRSLGSAGFRVLPAPGTPVTIRAGEELDFTVAFTPTTPGTAEAATIRIRSNDPGAPVVDVLATGLGGVADLQVVMPDWGDFGAVCLGEFVDRDLVLNNAGPCSLRISRITSSAAEFEIPSVTTYPLVVAAGASIDVPIRFRPSARGTASGLLQVFSNDPSSPASVRLRGTSLPPRLVLSIADSGDFGATCVGDFHDEALTIANSGDCLLTVTELSSSDPAFIVPEVDALPLTVLPGTAVELTLRFQPVVFGPVGAVITVVSDDPGGPRTIDVRGVAPSGVIAVTGTTDFGGVELGTHARQAIAICNVGDCDLHVTHVGFAPPCPCDAVRHHGCGCGCGGGEHDHHEPEESEGGKHHHHGSDQRCLNFRILSNPFPAVVHPGSCLEVLLEYVPTCDNSACCELVIHSDDPVHPTVTRFVTGHLKRTLRSALKCWAAQELNTILEAGRS